MKCGNCDRTSAADGSGLLRCSRCKDTWYCDKECQRKDRKNHKFRCDAISVIESARHTIPFDFGYQVGAEMKWQDILKRTPANIHNEFAKRDAASLALTKDPNALCTLFMERTWYADDSPKKNETIGPFPYPEAKRVVASIYRRHSSGFADDFNKCLALVGDFDTIEKINVPGGGKLSGKTMVVRIHVEKGA